MKPSVEYLGHTISADGSTSIQRNVQKLLDMMEEAKDISGVKSFITINKTTQERCQEVCVGEDQREAFCLTKQMLTQAPVLAYPDRNQVQILTTDAYARGIGCILSQSPDGSENNETVVEYGLRILRGAETRYSATHLEAFAVVWSVNYFRQYLADRRFILRTGHSSLKFIFENQKPTSTIDRWAAALMGYDFDVEYIRGVDNSTDSIGRFI